MCHAFRLHSDCELFVPDNTKDECFVASRMICQFCNHFWHTDLMECYLCGEINYPLKKCKKDHYSSLTSAKKKCKECNQKDPEKVCINEQCASNNNPIISKIQEARNPEGKRGIFENGTESSFKISQIHCVKCGNIANIYRNFLVFVEEWENPKSRSLIMNHQVKDHLVIFKKRLPIIKGIKELQYASFKGSQNPKNWQPKWSKLSETITEVFSSTQGLTHNQNIKPA